MTQKKVLLLSMKIRGSKGCVYVIKNLELNRIKIGQSKNPKKRFDGIRTQSGCEMSLLYFTKPTISYKEIESEMHKRLSKHRYIGEWFKFCPDEAINILKDVYMNLNCGNESSDVISMYEDGLNASQIAKKIGVSRSGIIKYLKDMGCIEPKEPKVKASKPYPKPKFEDKIKRDPKPVNDPRFLSPDRIKEMVKTSQKKITRVKNKKS